MPVPEPLKKGSAGAHPFGAGLIPKTAQLSLGRGPIQMEFFIGGNRWSASALVRGPHHRLLQVGGGVTAFVR